MKKYTFEWFKHYHCTQLLMSEFPEELQEYHAYAQKALTPFHLALQFFLKNKSNEKAIKIFIHSYIDAFVLEKKQDHATACKHIEYMLQKEVAEERIDSSYADFWRENILCQCI